MALEQKCCAHLDGDRFTAPQVSPGLLKIFLSALTFTTISTCALRHMYSKMAVLQIGNNKMGGAGVGFLLFGFCALVFAGGNAIDSQSVNRKGAKFWLVVAVASTVVGGLLLFYPK